MKTIEEQMMDEAIKLLTCSDEEFEILTKDRKEIIDAISKAMPSPEEMIKIGLERGYDKE